MSDLHVVILAAGQGKRMLSKTTKVLHKLAGVTLLERVVKIAQQLSPEKIHVVYGQDDTKKKMSHLNVEWAKQEEKLGTGHATLQAMANISNEGRVLVLVADIPVIQLKTLQQFLITTPQDDVGVITADVPNPVGLGRIIRNDAGNVLKIVEEKDADIDERQITEINSGVILAPASYLHEWLPMQTNDNQQQEYYLTDIIGTAVSQSIPVVGVLAHDYREVETVNSREQLASLERYYNENKAREFMAKGVSFADPKRVEFRGDVEIGQDVYVDINVIFENARVGSGSTVGAHSIVKDSKLADNVNIQPYSFIDGATVADECQIGPFARIRPETDLAEQVKVGNFVEIKKTKVEQGSKINHLSYIGDAQLGKNVNVGAGTITCNYDGANKHQTVLKDNVFVGSNTEIVAPVTVDDGATIAAGTTVTKDVAAGALTLSRQKQKFIESWARPVKDQEKK